MANRPEIRPFELGAGSVRRQAVSADARAGGAGNGVGAVALVETIGPADGRQTAVAANRQRRALGHMQAGMARAARKAVFTRQNQCNPSARLTSTAGAKRAASVVVCRMVAPSSVSVTSPVIRTRSKSRAVPRTV